jgi:parallel beta-helix repeat protein
VIKNNKITDANQTARSAGILLTSQAEATVIKNNTIQNNSVGLFINFDNAGLDVEQSLKFDNNTIRNNESDDIVVSSTSFISCDSSFKNNSNLTDNLKLTFLNQDNATLSGNEQDKYGDIIVCADGVTVEGVSAETLVLTGANGATISGVTITGTLSSNTTSNQGLVLVKSNNATVNNNEIVDNQNLVSPSDGVVNLSFSTDNSFSNNNVSDNEGMTAFQDSQGFGTFSNQYLNNTANGNGNGFDVRSNATVIGNTANNNTGVGFIISGSGSFYDDNTAIGNGVQNVTLNVSDCSNTIGDFDTGGAPANFIYATSTVNQSGGSFSTIVLCDADNSEISNVTTASLILINTDNAVIDGSVISGNGISLDTSSSATISNNDIINSASFGILAFFSPNAVVSGNNISNSGFQGMLVSVGSENWQIQGNTLQNPGFQGISINAASAALSGNTVNGSFGDGIVFFTEASGSTLNSNVVCGNSTDVNVFFGIATVTGDQNTCDTTANYTDASAASGCVFTCP